MKTDIERNEEMADEVANKYVSCSPTLGDSVQNKLDRLIVKQACVEMAKRKDMEAKRNELVLELNGLWNISVHCDNVNYKTYLTLKKYE